MAQFSIEIWYIFRLKKTIVSYYEEHARALPKGKLSKPCEFGLKLRLDIGGNGYITNHTFYKKNIADIGMLEESVEAHAKVFKYNFSGGADNRSFYDKNLIRELGRKI